MLAKWREERPELRQLVFRPGTIVGPDVHSPVTDLFEKPVILGIIGSDSPFVFIWDQDLVACLVDAVFSDKVGVFNQAGDGALTPREIARILDKPYVPLPATLVKGILWLLKSLRLGENGPERVKFLQYRPVLSNRRLKEEYGYTPELTSREAFELYARARGLLGSA
jgi:UDP-glucose 4-epimerase